MIRREIREQQALEFDSALLIQSAWRGYLSRRRAAFERMSKMATRVQRLWRGKTARDKADALWLRKHVVKIQKVARIFIQGHVFFQKRREQVVRAATQIQRFFRSYAAQKRRDERLHEKQVERRLLHVTSLRSQYNLLEDEILRLQREAKVSRLEDRLLESQRKEKECRGDLYQAEFDYLAFFRERACLSPRAMAQGFVENINKNIEIYRDKVTQKKLDVLFDVSRETRRLEEMYDLYVFFSFPLLSLLSYSLTHTHTHAHNNNRYSKKMSSLRSEKEYLMDVREEFMSTHYNRVQDFNQRRRSRREKQHLADQKRRWCIRYYRPSGKPDRKRRYGRPWDPSVYAHASSEKMIMTGDFFKVGKTIGTEQRAKLQNCFAQFQQYGALMKPLMSGMNTMSDRMGANRTNSGSSSKAPEENEKNTTAPSNDENNSKEDETKEKRNFASFSRTRKNRVSYEDEKIKRERGKRRHQRTRYKPTTKLWDMLDELEQVKSKSRKS